MPIYVDPLFRTMSSDPQARRVGARHGHLWSHLFADTLEELHAVARQIGMHRSWFQDHSWLPHYDLVPPRRAAAVVAGAVELDRRAAVVKWREMRERPVCVEHRAGWCALVPGANLDPMALADGTACGHQVMLRLSSERRLPTCPECLQAPALPLAAGRTG
jgi:hypothetical protein